MKSLRRYLFSLAVASAVGIGFVACGGSSTEDTEILGSSYYGAGSKWSISFGPGTKVSIGEIDSSLDINGTYEDLSSGFKKITVTASNDTTKAAVGAVTYGFELPGYMFPFVAFGENKLIPTVVSDGQCPTTVNHNYITSFAKSTTKTDGTIQDFDSWGTFGYWKYDSTQDKTSVSVYKRDGSLNNSMTFSGSIADECSHGTYYDPDGDPNDPYRAETTAFYTQNGGLIWQQRGLGNTIGSQLNDRLENDFMIPVEPDLNQISQIDGTYIGYTVVGNGQPSIGYTNTPVKVEVSNGTLTVKEITDITTGTTGNTVATIVLNTEVSGTKGLWSGTVTVSGANEGIGCAIDLNAGDSGKNVVICGGMNPDGTLKKLFSLIMVSK